MWVRYQYQFYFVDWDGYDYDESAVLAGFVDASKLAYCAVVYIVKKAGAGEKNRVSLVTSKTRVTPIKKISTLRLELLVALIVARLITIVQQALKSVMEISKTVCFSDSMTVLYWLKKENSLKQPGFNGPKFLQESEEDWPCGDTDFEPEFTEEVLKEMKAATDNTIMDQILEQLKQMNDLLINNRPQLQPPRLPPAGSWYRSYIPPVPIPQGQIPQWYFSFSDLSGGADFTRISLFVI